MHAFSTVSRSSCFAMRIVAFIFILLPLSAGSAVVHRRVVDPTVSWFTQTRERVGRHRGSYIPEPLDFYIPPTTTFPDMTDAYAMSKWVNEYLCAISPTRALALLLEAERPPAPAEERIWIVEEQIVTACRAAASTTLHRYIKFWVDIGDAQPITSALLELA